MQDADGMLWSMNLAQWCTTQLRSSSPRWWLLSVRALREILLRSDFLHSSTRVVSFPWGKRMLALPFSHNLPLYKAFTPLYDEPLRYWTWRLEQTFQRPLYIVNVGANVGDTYCLLQERTAHHVLAVEGEPEFLSYLQPLITQDKESQLAATFVGDGETSASVTPLSHQGTARLQTTSAHKSGSQSALPSLNALVQQSAFAPWRVADWIIIDTDGFDAIVLRGATDLLKHHPFVSFEYYPALWEQQQENPRAIWSWLQEQGYGTVWLYRNTGEYVGRFSLSRHHEWLSDLPEILSQFHSCPYVDVVAF